MWRPATLALALIVALSSVTMAVARHQPRALGTVSLCTATGVVALALDAKGRPAGPMLPCPDCTPALHALADAAPMIARPAPFVVPLRFAAPEGRAPSGRAPAHRHARAPPVLV